MSKKLLPELSRRSFLKTNSLFFLGNIVLNNPAIKLFTGSDDNDGPTDTGHDFSIELLRKTDLLQLQYFFYNAEIRGNHIHEKEGSELYIYIKVPPQHIAEELVLNYPRNYHARTDFKRQRSFLSQSTWLGFKLTGRLHKIPINADALLNWSGNFDLITLDTFFQRGTRQVDYQQTLDDIKKVGEGLPNTDFPQLESARTSPKMPLTTFELPYKMWLSPIAEPVKVIPPVKPDPSFPRMPGEHIFASNNRLRLQYYNKDEKDRHLLIVAPWENNLVYRNHNLEISNPRFKVTRMFCPDPAVDDGVELLPVPVYREELKQLTMLKNYDRDVLSDDFRISALGGTTNLKYKNDDPLIFSIVGWEQRIKYARDNYVSITFRTVDVFTGIKLLVSVIAERTFNYGISFLPKRYYVAYAEPQKIYTNPVVISKIPMVKITPLTTGSFFVPQTIQDPAPNKGAYIVADENGGPYDAAGILHGEQILNFKYRGEDKDGKLYDFTSKIIFIPAETYILTDGDYTSNDGTVYHQGTATNPTIIDIKDIGNLYPSRQKKFQNNPTMGLTCTPPGGVNYWYDLTKTFVHPAGGNLALITGIITAVQNHILAHPDIYGIGIFADLTFAQITALKTNNLIKPDSASTTLHTSVILLIPQVNQDEMGASITDDFFRDYDFPLIPTLATANVIIPQIDQIQGRSEYHWVKYADIYFKSKLDLDQPNPGAGGIEQNPPKLFLELITAIDNFFTDNFRSSGAVVNPGLKITHISALDKSIAYNDSHLSLGHNLGLTAAPFPNVTATSIFRGLNAEILGIPIIKIIEEVLPVGDLPDFAFVKDIEQSLNRLQQLANEYESVAGGWVSEYNAAVDKVKGIEQQISDAEQTFKLLSKGNLTTWFETLVSQAQVRDFYNSQKQALFTSAKPYKDYFDNTLSPLLTVLEHIFSIGPDLGKVIAAPTDPTNINALLVKLHAAPANYNEAYCKEAVKNYCIQQFVTGQLPEPIYQATQTVATMYTQTQQVYLSYYNAINQGLQEALDFSGKLVQAQGQKVNKQLDALINNIPAYILALIKRAGINLTTDSLSQWFSQINHLITIYDNYTRLYTLLKKDYYQQLELILHAGIDITPIPALEGILIAQMKTEIDALNLSGSDIPVSVQQAFNDLKKNLHDTFGNKTDLLSRYIDYADQVKDAVATAKKSYTDLLTGLYTEYNKELSDLQDLRKQLIDPKKALDNFVQNQLDKLRNTLDDDRRKLIAMGKADPNYQSLTNTVNQLAAFLQLVQQMTHQKLNYTISTKNFRSASFADVIEFIPQVGTTQLAINITYEVSLNISSPDKPPAISKQSFVTDSSLTNFKVGLLQLLYVDFEQVRFIAGSDVKDSFTVRVRDVDFGGFLSFFDAFKDYLKSLSDNLSFDISAQGATIGYELKIPDFQTGYFNFFNLGLAVSLVLPFNPHKSLEIHFGIGSSLSKFGLTLAGVFGGQGYFDIIADPKKGIIGMEICLEFGAIFHLEIAGIVEGTAYLVGGIYIRKYEGQFALRAYILCVGRLRVLGLFSACLSFYIGLEGDGHVLTGSCVVTASMKFGPFFEVSVQCEMHKDIQGTRSAEPAEEPAYLSQGSGADVNNGIKVADSNLYKEVFYHDEYLYITIENAPAPGDASNAAMTSKAVAGVNDKVQVMPAAQKTAAGKYTTFMFDMSTLDSGEYDITLNQGANNLAKSIRLARAATPGCPAIEQELILVDDYNYYASYY